MIRLRLPYPPSINHYYQRTHLGGLTLSSEGATFRKAVAAALLILDSPKVTGRLALRVLLCRPVKRLDDIDNRAKACLDAMQHGGLFKNDSQIDDLHLRRGPVLPPAGCAVVEIREVQP